MDIQSELKKQSISMRQAALKADIPYSTFIDIVKGKSQLEDCTYRTLKKLAFLLNTSVDKMMYQPVDFQVFRNNMHHKINRDSKIKVMSDIIESGDIDYYWQNNDYIKALYLLALLDTFSQDENIPLVAEYSKYRSKSLEEPFYVGDSGDAVDQSYLPEFKKHNIFEGDLYDAV